MSQRHVRLVATGTRIAAGAVVALACVAAVAGAVAAPLPTVQRSALSRTVTPVPNDAVLVCNGSFRAMGRDATQAALMVSAATMGLRLDGDRERLTSEPLQMPDVSGGQGAQSIIGTVQDRKVPVFSAVETVRLNLEDAAGLAAAPCREPLLDSWLVGGDNSTGVSGVILLSNPGAVTASVDLEVFGDRRTVTTVIVPAHTQLGVPLAGVSARSVAPVVHVSSSGAPVRATLQTTAVRALTPVGMDLQDGVNGPQNRQVILGVQAAQPTGGDDAAGAVVRLLAPSADGQATLTVRAAGSWNVVDEYPVDLVATKPTEVELSGLPDGSYDLVVESSTPVLAAAKQTVQSGGQEDFAWSLPSPELPADVPLPFSVPDAEPANVYVHNTTSEEVTVELTGADQRSIKLKPEGSAAITVRAGGYMLTANGRIQAAVGLRGTGSAATVEGWPLWSSAATQHPITVTQ